MGTYKYIDYLINLKDVLKFKIIFRLNDIKHYIFKLYTAQIGGYLQ